MKAQSVKSNAKRSARQLADRFSGIDVAEPVPATIAGAGWYPTVRIAPGCLPSAVAPEVFEAAIVLTENGDRYDPNAPQQPTEPQQPAEPASLSDDDFVVPAFLRGSMGTEPAPVPPVEITPEEVRAIASAEPVKSSPEEIAARRQARRDRLAAKPAEAGPSKRRGTVTADGAPKKDAMIDMLKRPQGATAIEIAKLMGWQQHTARARISVECRARGIHVEKVAKDQSRGGNIYRATA